MRSATGHLVGRKNQAFRYREPEGLGCGSVSQFEFPICVAAVALSASDIVDPFDWLFLRPCLISFGSLCAAPSALWAASGELLAHRLVHRVDRFQRSDHHLEAVDPIFGIPTDDVDAVDRQTSEPGLELQHSRLLT